MNFIQALRCQWQTGAGDRGRGAMPARVLAEPALLMTMTDIAELADVRRPVVTTWRRRHADFPAPAGGDESQPLFDPHEVAAWLLATGRISRERAEQELSLFTLTGLAARYDGPDVMPP